LGTNDGDFKNITIQRQSGFVGINQESPNYELDVNGKAHVADNVGIWTTPNTSSKLQVRGNIAIEDIANNIPSSLNIGMRQTPPLAFHGDARLFCAGKGVFQSLFVYEPNSWVNWPDFVFEKDYSLPKLKGIENFITKEKHLPGVPTAKEVNEKGVDLLEINKILFQKIEEMTLHLIRLEKEVELIKATK